MSLLPHFFKSIKRQSKNTAIVSTDDMLRSAFNQDRRPSLHGSVCFAPSVNMIFSETGEIKVCCHNSENVIGRYPEQRVSEIWNGGAVKVFRQKMKNYQFLSGCRDCESDYRSGNFNEMSARHFDDVPAKETYPSMMEFMLSNTCNLECVMCSGELSSSIRRNRDHLPPVQSPYDPSFIEQLNDFIPHLVETRFSSAGEAFLIDLNFKLWEKLLALNPNCRIVVQTNGTVLNARVKDFLQRGNFSIGVSLDSLQKENFEAIRVHASFEKVMEHIAYFSAYSKQHNRPFTISTCVMRQNWHELPDFIHFCNRHGALATFHKVWLPLEYAMHNLPAEELRAIHTTLSAHHFDANTVLEKRNLNHYRYFVSLIAGWASEAEKKGSPAVDFSQFTTPALLLAVKQNFKTHIESQHILELNHQELIELCNKKIEEIISLCADEGQKRARLIALHSTPVSFSLPAIKTHSAQRLFEMSQNQLKD